MRTIVSRTLPAIALLVGLMLPATRAQAQDEPMTKDGTVFTVSMVRTGANSMTEYLNYLTTYYIPSMEAAKTAGLILSYRILSGDFSNEDDYNVMLMVEYPNLAAMDPDPAREAKWKALRDELTAKIGGEEKLKAMREGVGEIRTFQGEKLMRTVLLK